MSTGTTISEQIGGLPSPGSEENVLLTAWEEALGEVLAEQQRQWMRERALIEAKATATVAELRSEIAKLRCEFDRMVNERLSGLRDGAPGLPGAPGPRGEPGPPGREGHLRNVTEWSGRVHYRGDVVVHGGSTWWCANDTGHPPPHDDWTCIASVGRDGHTPTIRGTWNPEGDYGMLDVVAFNGGSFVALRDDPGVCPGQGWQALCLPGKRGHQGPRGERGERGPQGQSAPTIVAWEIDRQKYAVRPVMSDGCVGVPLELRGLFEQYNDEVC